MRIMAESLIPQVNFNRETIDMSVYDNPTQMFSAASQHAEAWVTDHVPDSFKDSANSLRDNAISRATGLFLGLYAERTEEPRQLITTTEAMGKWLADPLSSVPRHKDYPLPTNEIRSALFSKIIVADWVNDYDALNPIVEGLGQLTMPTKNAPAAAKSFAKNMKMQLEGGLRGTLDDDPYLREEIVLVSAMTDRGIFKEGVWGKVGIGNFTPDTPFAVTEEVHRRYVMEGHDTFTPLNNRVLQETMGKYALNVLRQAMVDNRKPGSVEEALAAIIASTSVVSRIAQTDITSISGEKIGPALIDYYNKEVDLAFFTGGKESRLLSQEAPSSVGSALARILRMTRHDDMGKEAYSDSLHVEIVHKMATTHTSDAARKPVWRPSAKRGW